METATLKQNSPDDTVGRETLIVAHRKEAVVGIPVVIRVVEVKVAVVVRVEFEHAPIAVHLGVGALCEKPSVPLSPDGFAGTVSYS